MNVSQSTGVTTLLFLTERPSEGKKKLGHSARLVFSYQIEVCHNYPEVRAKHVLDWLHFHLYTSS